MLDKIYTTDELVKILREEQMACVKGQRTFPMPDNAEEIAKQTPLGSILGAQRLFKGIDSVLAVLGLDKFPNSEREIKSAYRKQAKLHNPDTGGDANKFREVQMAYETAINLLPELRKAYGQ